MPPSNLTTLLESALYSFQAAQLSLAAWTAQESPTVVKNVMRQLAGTKTLEEFIAALRTIVEG